MAVWPSPRARAAYIRVYQLLVFAFKSGCRNFCADETEEVGVGLDSHHVDAATGGLDG